MFPLLLIAGKGKAKAKAVPDPATAAARLVILLQTALVKARAMAREKPKRGNHIRLATKQYQRRTMPRVKARMARISNLARVDISETSHRSSAFPARAMDIQPDSAHMLVRVRPQWMLTKESDQGILIPWRKMMVSHICCPNLNPSAGVKLEHLTPNRKAI